MENGPDGVVLLDPGAQPMDGIVWALAAPRGLDPRTGKTVTSMLKPVGKAIMGIAIVNNSDGDKTPLWKLLLIRMWFFPLILLVALIPYAIIPIIDQALIFTQSRRCLHDLLCGTAVIKISKSK